MEGPNTSTGSGLPDYPITLRAAYPERSSRWLAAAGVVGFKLIMLVPHFLALPFLLFGAIFLGLGGWVVVILTGNYSRLLFEFQVGLLQWVLRVSAWYLGLADRYPPFRLRE